MDNTEIMNIDEIVSESIKKGNAEREKLINDLSKENVARIEAIFDNFTKELLKDIRK